MTAPRYLLDTNVLSAVARGLDLALIAHFRETQIEDIAISTLSVMEIEFGLLNNLQLNKQRGAMMRGFVRELTPIAFVSPAALAAAKHLLRLKRSGAMIGPYDLLIAATALAHDLTMVTANTGEFARISELQVEDWSSAA